MYKYLIALLALVFVGGFATFYFYQIRLEVELKEFTDSKHGYSFKYPKNLSIRESNDGVAVFPVTREGPAGINDVILSVNFVGDDNEVVKISRSRATPGTVNGVEGYAGSLRGIEYSSKFFIVPLENGSLYVTSRAGLIDQGWFAESFKH